MIPTDRDVLLVVDVQVDFLPGGALAVPDGDAVIGPINRLADLFPHVVLTQDWHPPGHASFATSYPGRAPFETIPMPYGRQMLWPEHCVQGSAGAALASTLRAEHAELIIRKGHHPAVDSYSAFVESDRTTRTGLAGYLKERGFTRVVLCGLATDYCVAWSALDARAAGFETVVVEDAVRGIDPIGVTKAWAEMNAAGITRMASAAIRGSDTPDQGAMKPRRSGE